MNRLRATLTRADHRRPFGAASMALAFACLLALFQSVYSAPIKNFPQTITQPGGAQVQCFVSGDEYYSWLHDQDGYVIVKDSKTGCYEYAVLKDGELAASGLAVGQGDPRELGVAPNLRPSAKNLKAKVERAIAARKAPESISRAIAAPRTGVINNLVILIRFSDEPEYTDKIGLYDKAFNSMNTGEASMRGYYEEASYGQLHISTTFYPTPNGTTIVSYQDSNPRKYYMPKDSSNPDGYDTSSATEQAQREHLLLKSAIDYVKSQIPSSLRLDGDGDGNVDNICFIVSGKPTAWNTLLWPHQWTLYSYTVRINGKKVSTYNLQLQAMLDVGVLCHEMFHSLGSPDLYHYSYDGLHTVGSWDVMEGTTTPPQHMGAYMKFRYGKWISNIPEITEPGVYRLTPLVSTEDYDPLADRVNNCWKIASPNNKNQFYVLEYRKTAGTYESSLPGSGLLVYRINSQLDGVGNAQGPPDEVYLYRPGGSRTADGDIDSAAFSAESHLTNGDDSVSWFGFLANGALGGLSIHKVGTAGDTIEFTYGEPPIAAQISFPLDADPGWTCEGNWAYGKPAGLGGNYKGYPDPTNGYTNYFVYGYNLKGDYESDMTASAYLTTTAIDCTYLSNVQLRFWRWLNVESNRYDYSSVEVSNDGENWTTLWTPADEVLDSGWTQMKFDVPWIADGQPTVYFRWGIGTTDPVIELSGWNIDDVEIFGNISWDAPTPTPTESPVPTISETPSLTPSPSTTPTLTLTPSVTPTATPSLTESPTPAPSASPTPSLTPLPTLSPSLTPSPSRTPFPTYTTSPTPTISPTPSPTQVEVAGGQDLTSGSLGWTAHDAAPLFAKPTMKAVTGPQGGLLIQAESNTNTFGYWESMKFNATTLAAETTTATASAGLALSAVLPSDSALIDAEFTVAGTVSDIAKAPQIRLRMNTGNLQQSCYTAIESGSDGADSPTTYGVVYPLLFLLPSSAQDFTLAMDLLNFDQKDEANGGAALRSVALTRRDLSRLSQRRTVHEYDFSNSPYSSIWYPALATVGFTAPLYSTEANAISMRGKGGTNTYGSYSSVDPTNSSPKYDFTLDTKSIYLISFTIESNVALAKRSTVPALRCRVNESSLHASSVLVVESAGDGALSPASGYPMTYWLFFVPTAASQGKGLILSVDYMNFNAADQADATLKIKGATVQTIPNFLKK